MMLSTIGCCVVNQLLLSLGTSPSRRIESILLRKQPSRKTRAPLDQESALKCPRNGCVSVKATAQTTHQVSLTGQWWGEVKSLAKTLDCTKLEKKFNNATSRRPTRISTNKIYYWSIHVCQCSTVMAWSRYSFGYGSNVIMSASAAQDTVNLSSTMDTNKTKAGLVLATGPFWLMHCSGRYLFALEILMELEKKHTYQHLSLYLW